MRPYVRAGGVMAHLLILSFLLVTRLATCFCARLSHVEVLTWKACRLAEKSKGGHICIGEAGGGRKGRGCVCRYHNQPREMRVGVHWEAFFWLHNCAPSSYTNLVERPLRVVFWGRADLKHIVCV